ncbi:histidine kinase [Nocardia sp. NPDC004278]
MRQARACIRALCCGLARFALGPLEVLAAATQLLAIALACIGLIFFFPPVVERTRVVTSLARRLSGTWSRVPVADPYRAAPRTAVRGADTRFHASDGTVYPTARTAAFALRSRWIWTDPATWRDLVWTLADPIVGGALAIAPSALIGSGVAMLVLQPAVVVGTPIVALVAGLLCMVAGVLLAPRMLMLHGKWTRLLLGPASEAAITRAVVWRRRFGVGLLSSIRCLVIGVLSLLAPLLLLVCLLAVVLTGPVVAMWAVAWARWLPNMFRQWGIGWFGRELPRPYACDPRRPTIAGDGAVPPATGWAGLVARARNMWFDPATWRDLLWLACQPLAGPPMLLPVASIGYGLWGLTLPVLQAPLGTTLSPWYGELFGSVWAAIIVGPILITAGFVLAPPLLQLHGRWLGLLLVPTAHARLRSEREQLAVRIEQLTETRTAATDTLTAELRRIERDLHDGAQARMVAVGMTLSTVEVLIDRDPVAAKALVAQARDTSAAALAELRGLVRGIHPPVLAERGLVDAIRALALDSPIPVQVDATLDTPVDAPVESALYFAIAEALTNAVRYSCADQILIGLHEASDLLRVTVHDNGAGGADPTRGSGLRGIERRLASFDGRVILTSPPGGPTVVIFEVPHGHRTAER